MMRTFLSFFFVLFGFIGSAQLKLDVELIDIESKKNIPGVGVKLISAAGQEFTCISDKKGKASFNLEANAAYLIRTTSSYHRAGRDNFTTIGKTDSVNIVRLLELEPVFTIYEHFTRIDFDSTYNYCDFDLHKDTIIFIKREDFRINDSISFYLSEESATTYKVSSDPDRIISIVLIDNNKIEITDGKQKMQYWIRGIEGCFNYWYELIKLN